MKTIIPALLLTPTTHAQETPPSNNNPATPSWLDSIKCTADFDSSNPSIIDEQTCLTRTDANSESCLWCDLSAFVSGQDGLCVSSSIKNMVGQFWETLCSGQVPGAPDSNSGTNSPVSVPDIVPINPPLQPIPDVSTPSPVSPPPTSSPMVTPPAVDPPPVVPPPDNSFAGAFSCAQDSNSKLISDPGTCTAKKDATSSDGKMCVWCPVPFVGGGCITNSDASSISWMCRGFEAIMDASVTKQTTHLRGDKSDVVVEGWDNIMDTSCLGDELNCPNRKDKSGNTCIYCDGGGVLGFCVSPAQQEYVGKFMTCGAKANDLTAVE